HSLREGADLVLGPIAQPDRLQHRLDLVRPGGAWQGRELAVQREHLPRGQPGLVAKQLGQVPDAPSGAEVAHPLAQQPALAGRRLEEAEQVLDRGCLAGAVRTEEREEFPASPVYDMYSIDAICIG